MALGFRREALRYFWAQGANTSTIAGQWLEDARQVGGGGLGVFKDLGLWPQGLGGGARV